MGYLLGTRLPLAVLIQCHLHCHHSALFFLVCWRLIPHIYLFPENSPRINWLPSRAPIEWDGFWMTHARLTRDWIWSQNFLHKVQSFGGPKISLLFFSSVVLITRRVSLLTPEELGLRLFFPIRKWEIRSNLHLLLSSCPLDVELWLLPVRARCKRACIWHQKTRSLCLSA